MIPARMGSLKMPTETAVAWCGSQTSFATGTHPLLQYNAFVTSRSMDKDRGVASYARPGFYFVRRLNPTYEQQQIVCDFLTDYPTGDPTTSPYGVRTRHVRNSNANLLFVDGHVEARIGKDCLRTLFCVTQN